MNRPTTQPSFSAKLSTIVAILPFLVIVPPQFIPPHIREHLLEKVDLELIGKVGNPAMSAIEVLRNIGYDKPTNPQCKECGGILREMFGESKKINGFQKYRIPLKRSAGPITSIDDDCKY